MKIGVFFNWQNTTDWDRYLAKDSSPQVITDQQIYDEEIYLGDLVEPLGFDSYWAIDHYFTPYGMTGGALQNLTRFAGRTNRIDVGTMVVVLPWYNPLLVAHQISVLDNMLQGRQLTLGLGRGASFREFDPLGIPMGDARGRFMESLDVLKLALTKEFFSFEGEYFQIPETSIRPKFRNPERLLDRMRIAWNSPETLPIAAKAGVGIFMTGQKSFADYRKDVGKFNGLRAESGWAPVQPTVTVRISCFESETEAWDVISAHMVEAQRNAHTHYGFGGVSKMGDKKGYEQYAALDNFKITDEQIIEKEALPQAWGTPDQVFEKLQSIQQVTGAEEFVCNFRYGSMPAETAERSMRLFAEKVLPRLHKMDTPLDPSLTGAASATSA
ncbi:LLM class flavin-dependent oxidoreductase [Amycolatopsis sp. GM8]|uniref:LLM class flavin-dependent oxidoreductase n=1 Tax=Amycolatopsis sp. GM8 TaxID=2896530 RepID=UPI001F2992C8|nr:LLM class flavin-dependent oxidoreductase [Amycolatopsis sp. GM8]